ncbi:MAG: hypothetical protein JWP97_3000 [Labilithrix sp.]|nr:hypothetical protein [Labilithrix sp.]
MNRSRLSHVRGFTIGLLVLATCAQQGCVAEPASTAVSGGTGTSQASLTTQEITARKAAIRDYFAGRVAALPTVATTTTSGGTVVDWVKPKDLWATTATPPPALVSASAPRAGGSPPYVNGAVDKPVSNELLLEPKAMGPAGTVPIVRFDVEHYLASVAIPPARPQDIMVKAAPAPEPDTPDRYYVSWHHFGYFLGSDGFINIWNAGGPREGETNIAQVALASEASGVQETVEAGKIEAPLVNGGSYDAFFFVYFTNNGYTESRNWAGGYNTTVHGWHQVSRTWAPGVRLTPSSTSGGDQRVLHLEVRQGPGGDWWVGAEGEWVGYYPRCVNERAGCADGSVFRSSGLAEGAGHVTWYGEVFDSLAPAPTDTPMGSADLGAAGFRRAAYFRSMAYTSDNRTGFFFELTRPIYATDASCYSGAGPAGDGTVPWANYFFYGGPGAGSSACK